MLLRFLYQILFPAAFVLGMPYYLLRMWKRGRVWDALEERWGIYPQTVRKKIAAWGDARPIWIHAVSVGEVKIAQTLLPQLRALNPAQNIVLTTTTQTGRALALQCVDEHTAVLYNPFDFFWVVRRAFDVICPSQYVLVEGEIWPNCLWEAGRRKVPVSLINARLSDRSWRRYQKLSGWVSSVLNQFLWIGLQHQSEIPRFAQAGFPPHKLFVTGSMKFEVSKVSNKSDTLAREIRDGLGWAESDPVLLAGSTCRGEEEMVLQAYEQIRHKFPKLKCVIAPRHVERTREVMDLFKAHGLRVIRRTQIADMKAETMDALLVDTTGELSRLYAMATVVVIGRSFVDQGGSNFIEPVQYDKPVIVGPFMSNFAALVSIFMEQKAILSAKDAHALASGVDQLLRNDGVRNDMVSRARQVFEQHSGAAKRSAELILASSKS